MDTVEGYCFLMPLGLKKFWKRFGETTKDDKTKLGRKKSKPGVH